MPVITPHEIVERILRGEIRAAARLMRWLDDETPGAVAALKALHPHTGRAHVVGITGNPGSGKSTLTDRLIAHYRRAGKRVGVVAVDPSSPFSGGAILGDRIRMQAHATDPGVFIRSLATRGHLGGLSRSTDNVVRVLDAMGYDIVLVETVGVGQDEVEIIRTAHTSVVVLVPGMGDDIQAIKAGILEVADLFVINKADREGADRVVLDLKAMMSLMSEMPPWVPEILRTVAVRDEGVAEVVDAVARHYAFLRETGTLRARERAREHHVLMNVLKDRAMSVFEAELRRGGALDEILEQLAARIRDPYSLAESVLSRVLNDRPPEGDR